MHHSVTHTVTTRIPSTKNMHYCICSIQGHSLRIVEYNGQRVVTLAMIDEVHERPDGTARKRFNDNKNRFIEGEDFCEITQASEIRTLGLSRPDGSTPAKIILLTETGYLMLVKSFTDDLAWKVQRELVNGYFRAKTQPVFQVPQTLSAALALASEQAAQLEIARPKAEAFDELANTEGLFTLRDSAKLCGWPERIFIKRLTMPPIKWLYAQSSSGRKLAYAAAIQAGHIEVKEVTIFHKTTGREMYGQPMITQKGLAKLRLLLGPYPENSNMLAISKKTA